ncbi:MAG: hypothetical protein QF464_17930, partial [Myxococcota bacterium]|nr:hypothetical protein [Myxococcota bacterium]
CQCVTIADCAPLQTPGLCDGSLDCFDGLCVVDPATVLAEPCDTSLDGPCDNTGCNLETGECETVPDTGTPCGDGDACSVQDACVEGVCVGVPRDCTFLDEACAIGECQPEDGECLLVVASDDAPCTNGDPCTEGEICAGGVCGGGEPVDCSGLDSLCADGECSGEHGGCIGVPINEGGVCDDSDMCTDDDSCVLGTCSGEAKDCDLEIEDCAVGGCDPASGECVLVAIDEADECDDGDACTTEDTCDEGLCVGALVDCGGEASSCQVASCDPATGCAFEPIANGAPCDDGDACTVATSCEGGSCLGEPLDCSGESIGPCELVACDPAWGACVVTHADDETPCDDGDACTTGERCYGGVCEGDPVDCPGSPEVCAVHACDPVTGGCISDNVGDGETCDDGNPCTDGDVCVGGGCGGQEIDCGTGTACASSGCDPESGGCVLSTYDDGTPCDDANLCTQGDACTGGQCIGEGTTCESEEFCKLLT